MVSARKDIVPSFSCLASFKNAVISVHVAYQATVMTFTILRVLAIGMVGLAGDMISVELSGTLVALLYA